MGDALGIALVLIADLAIGVLLGWSLCNAMARRRDRGHDRDVIERMFRRNDELFRIIYTVLRQSREYTGRLGQMREHLQRLPASATTRTVTRLIESMDGELTTTHDRLQRHLDLTQEATATARRVYQPTSRSFLPSNLQVTLDSRVTTDNAVPETEAASVLDSVPDARREERQPYLREQMAAPYIQGQIPKPEMFQVVQCCDLSSGGVSYLAPDRPKSDMIVITIGDERDLVYRTARVVKVAEVEGAFRVGCQFTGRLHRHLFC